MSAVGSAATHFDQPEVWARKYTPFHKHRIETLVSMIPDGVRRILEIGCGSGEFAHQAQRRGYEVVGCDLHIPGLARLRAKKCLGRADQLMFAAQSYDLVVAGEVLEHIPEPFYRPSLYELVRVAKQYVLVSGPYREVLAAAAVKCQNCGQIYHAYEHVRSYDDSQIQDLLPGMSLLKKRLIGVAKRYSKFELYLRFNLGKYYSREPYAVCPRCGAARARQGFPPIAAIVAEGLCRARSLMMRSPSNFVALYGKP